MSTNIIGVTMTAPGSDPGIDVGGNFPMTGVISTAGGGGWNESGDMYFEWDQGTATWVTIGTSSAAGLYHSATNPILTLQTTNPQTLTVYGGAAGSFQVRVTLIEDDLTTYNTAAIDVTVSAVAGTQLVHTDAGEDYSLFDDNDGSALTLTQVHILDIAEAFSILDDNDGASLTITQDHTLDVAEAHSLVNDNDELSITLSNVYVLDVAEAYSLIDDNDGSDITIVYKSVLAVAESHCLIDDNDGAPITTTTTFNLVVAESYHEHVADGDLVVFGGVLEIAEAYHVLEDAGPITVVSGSLARVTHALVEVLRDGDPKARVTQALVEVLRLYFHPWGAYHTTTSDNIETMSFTAWDGGDVGTEGTIAAARNYRMIILSADFDYGESDGFVRARLKGAPTEAVTINGASIGQRKAAADAFDYDSSIVTPVRLTFNGGSSTVALPANTVVVSDWVPFAVDKTKDHLLHLFIDTDHKYSYRVDSQCYRVNSGNDQTMMEDVKSYSLVDEFLFFVNLDVRPREAMVASEPYHEHAADGDIILKQITVCHETYHDIITDPIALTQTHDLVIEEAYHLHDADSFDLSVTITTAETYHDIATDPVILTQAHDLVIEEAFHLHDADNVVVVTPGSAAAEDAYHEIVTDTADLTQTHILSVNECYSLTDDNDGSALAITAFDIWADSYDIAVGTLNAGSLADTYADDANYLIINEVTGTPGFAVDFTFDYIPTSFRPIWFDLHGYYEGNPAHKIKVQAWNYTTLGWDYLTINTNDMPDREDDSHYGWQISDYDNQVANKQVKLRILHDWAGSAGHYLHINKLYVALEGNISIVVDEAYHALDDNDANPLTLTQEHSIVIAECYHDCVSDTEALTQTHSLLAAETYHLHDVDAIALTQAHELVVAEAYHLHDVDGADVTTPGSAAAEEAYHEIITGAIALTQGHILSVEEAYHLHEADESSVTPFLSIAEAYHDIITDPVALTQGHDLVVEEAYHLHDADAAALIVTLAVDESYHLHDGEGLVLNTGVSLVVAESYHLHDGENLDITQGHDLVVEESYHETSSDNLVLGGVAVLTVNDGDSLHYVDGISLVQIYSLVIADAYHAHEIDNVALTQEHSIVIQEAVDLLVSDNVSLSGTHSLAVAGAFHAQASDQVNLSGASALVIPDAAHLHTSGAIVLGISITPSDSYHSVESDNLTITTRNFLKISDAVELVTSDNIRLVPSNVLPFEITNPRLISITPRRAFASATPIRRFAA